MTQKKQRIAIAKACGWNDIIFRGIIEPKERDYIGRHPSCIPQGMTGCWSGTLPDYLNDLNAMHEAEKTLTARQKIDFCFALSGNPMGYHDLLVKAVMATATQRAEAFLKTIGKWEEDAERIGKETK